LTVESKIAVETTNLSYISPSGKKLLDNLNCKISKGSIVGILGDSKSGKEIFLQTLNKIIPTFTGGIVEGKIIVNGLNVMEHTVNELAREIYTILEEPSLQIVQTIVYDDVAFGPSNMQLPTSEIRRRVDFALESTRLSGYEERNCYTLSGGEQQRLAIAGGIAMLPKIICMINPFSMLDPIGKKEISAVISQLNKNYNITFLITDGGQDIEILARLSDELIFMDNGKIINRGPPKELFSGKYEIDMRFPEIAELFTMLDGNITRAEIPLSVSEAVEFLTKLLRGKRQKISKTSKEPDKISKKVDPIITVRNLEHTYPGPPPVKALRGISLDIYPGELVAIIGQNGGGKSTLALHLVGILKPTNPEAIITVDGIDVPNASTMEIINHINYVFQNPNDQIFTEKVWDEVAFGLKMRGLNQEEIRKRVQETLRLFGLEQYANEHTAFLTPGIKTLLALASVAIMNPRILIIDEPTGGLDYKEADHVLKIIQALNETGKTIILITHDMRIVSKFTSRVIVIHQGQILLDGSPSEVFAREDLLKKAYIEPPEIAQLARELGLPLDILTVEDMYKYLRGVLSWSG
jgi:energy-coupling factor transport system ATP-binding protein